MVEFDPASYTVSESGGSVTLTIVKRGMIGGPLQVEFSTADGTAIGNTAIVHNGFPGISMQLSCHVV